MTVVTDTELYLRGTETLLASWEEYARGASDSALRRFPGVPPPCSRMNPERTVYAALLVPLAQVTLADAYLATTPGGLYAVLAASVGIAANTTFVVSMQVLRVLIMVVAAPPLVRIVTRRDTVQSG